MKILTSIKFNEDTLKKYKEYAEKNDMTFTELVKISVNEYIHNHNNNEENLQNNK